MSDFDPMDPFMEVSGEFEARTIIAVLEDAGIDARVFVLGNLGLPHSLTPGARGVVVHVRRSQANRARRVLAESRQIGASVDWDSLDLGDSSPPPVPGRPPKLWTILWRAAAVTFLAGAGTSLIAWMIGASVPAMLEALTGVLIVCFTLMVISLGLREYLAAPGGSSVDGAPPDRDQGPGGRRAAEPRPDSGESDDAAQHER